MTTSRREPAAPDGCAWSDALTIDPAGRVGIGTGSPQASLDVAEGDQSAVMFGPNATAARLCVGASSTNKAGPATAQLLCTNRNLHLDPSGGLMMYLGNYAYSHLLQ
jgi:hypothetical protein